MRVTFATTAAWSSLAGLALATSACQQGATNTSTSSAEAPAASNSTDVPVAGNASNSMTSAQPMSDADRAAYMARQGVGFSAMDADSNGRVTLDEAKAYTLRPLTLGGDSDGDGAMSAAELARVAPEVRTSMLRSDSNGDGAVSAAEFDARIEARFRAGDTNGDGGMTEQEIQAAQAAAAASQGR